MEVIDIDLQFSNQVQPRWQHWNSSASLFIANSHLPFLGFYFQTAFAMYSAIYSIWVRQDGSDWHRSPVLRPSPARKISMALWMCPCGMDAPCRQMWYHSHTIDPLFNVKISHLESMAEMWRWPFSYLSRINWMYGGLRISFINLKDWQY